MTPKEIKEKMLQTIDKLHSAEDCANRAARWKELTDSELFALCMDIHFELRQRDFINEFMETLFTGTSDELQK